MFLNIHFVKLSFWALCPIVPMSRSDASCSGLWLSVDGSMTSQKFQWKVLISCWLESWKLLQGCLWSTINLPWQRWGPHPGALQTVTSLAFPHLTLQIPLCQLRQDTQKPETLLCTDDEVCESVTKGSSGFSYHQRCKNQMITSTSGTQRSYCFRIDSDPRSSKVSPDTPA